MEPREEEAASGVEIWRSPDEPAAARCQGGQGGQDTSNDESHGRMGHQNGKGHGMEDAMQGLGEPTTQ